MLEVRGWRCMLCVCFGKSLEIGSEGARLEGDPLALTTDERFDLTFDSRSSSIDGEDCNVSALYM